MVVSLLEKKFIYENYIKQNPNNNQKIFLINYTKYLYLREYIEAKNKKDTFGINQIKV